MFCIGSGSALAYGVLDSAFNNDTAKNSTTIPRSSIITSVKEEEIRDIPLDEAINIAVKAIRHAAHRDSYSGGYINVFHIDENGAHHVYREDSRNIPLGQRSPIATSPRTAVSPTKNMINNNQDKKNV